MLARASPPPQAMVASLDQFNLLVEQVQNLVATVQAIQAIPMPPPTTLPPVAPYVASQLPALPTLVPPPAT